MKEVMVITDTISSITPELAEKYDVIAVPYHFIMDGKDYLDNTYDREQFFARLESHQNLPTASACTQGEILEAYKKASKKVKSILFISISSAISAAYNAALQAKEMAKEEIPGITIEVVDSHSSAGGELLVVLAAARAANEGKNLSEVTEIARRLAPRVNLIHAPETLFFFERTGRGNRDSTATNAPVTVFSLLEMDDLSGGAAKCISKSRTKTKVIETLLKLVRKRSGGKKLRAVINYTTNPDDAEKLKEKLLSRFEVIEVFVIPATLVTSWVHGPRCLSLGFHSEG